MQEIELKFQIPPARLASVRDAIQQAGARIEPLGLQAAYFDTADSLLARHRMALRVRREGADWVQTFKAAGKDAMTRVEDNQPASAPLDGRIRPVLALHTHPSVRQALAKAFDLGDMGSATADTLGLQAVYETRFERWSKPDTRPQGQVIVCLDIGEVVAGQLRESIQELEIELSEGQAGAVIDAARHWVDKHGVWLDVQSKAHRGTRLAQADRQGLPAPAAIAVTAALAPPTGQADAPSPRRILSMALDAAAGNWSEVATARPGHERAVRAWHDVLNGLLDLSQRHAALRQALHDRTWLATQALAAELAHLSAHPGDAPALACSPRVSHWGLDVLSAIHA